MGDEAEAAKILGKLNTLKEQRQTIVSKIAELDGEHTEHNLVINTLEPLPADRRCFRMIGEVLVERTNAEVLKAVIENRDNLKKAMSEMSEVLMAKERELLDHIKKHNIRQTNDAPGTKRQPEQAPARSSGVLV